MADALQRIESSLDVLNIIRNFNLLKVLTHLLLDQRHFDLAQYVGFELWREEYETKKERDEEEKKTVLVVRKSASKEKDKSPKKSVRVELEKSRFRSSLTMLKDSISITVREFDLLKPRVTALMDTFYYLQLLGKIPDYEEPNDEEFELKLMSSPIRQPDESEDNKQTFLFTNEADGHTNFDFETKEGPLQASTPNKLFSISRNASHFKIRGDLPIDLSSEQSSK